MIEINLIKEDQGQSGRRGSSPKKPFEAQKPLILACFGIAVAAVAAVDYKFYMDLKKVQGELRSITRQMNSPAHVGKLQKARDLQEELDTLNKKKAIIVDLIENRIHWSKKLGSLRDNLPSDIWIEKIQLTDPTNPRDDPYQTLEISAATTNYARGYARVAETIEKLDKSKEFMEGFQEPLIDKEIRNEKWDPSQREEAVDVTVCRFSFQAKRPLPETEKVQKK